MKNKSRKKPRQYLAHSKETLLCLDVDFKKYKKGKTMQTIKSIDRYEHFLKVNNQLTKKRISVNQSQDRPTRSVGNLAYITAQLHIIDKKTKERDLQTYYSVMHTSSNTQEVKKVLLRAITVKLKEISSKPVMVATAEICEVD